MCMYLRAKLEVSYRVLDRGGGGAILTPTPPQNEPLKSPSRLGVNDQISLFDYLYLLRYVYWEICELQLSVSM